MRAIQINNDKNNQLKNTLKIKLEELLYKEGELFKKTTKRVAVANSIKGYFIEMDLLQFLHLYNLVFL